MKVIERTKKFLRRVLLVALTVYALAFCARLIFSLIDYSRIDAGGRPLFARTTWSMADGGSQEFEGFGYMLTRRHRIHETDGQSGYIYGPILQYKGNYLLIPLPSRENLRFVSELQ